MARIHQTLDQALKITRKHCSGLIESRSHSENPLKALRVNSHEYGKQPIPPPSGERPLQRKYSPFRYSSTGRSGAMWQTPTVQMGQR